MKSFFFFSCFLTDIPTKGGGKKVLFLSKSFYSCHIDFLSSTPCALRWYHIFLHYLYWYSILTHGLTYIVWAVMTPVITDISWGLGVPNLLHMKHNGTGWFTTVFLFFEKWLLFIQRPRHYCLTLFLTPTIMFWVIL